ncbi:hypothetical protein J6590_071007 [Homalodisca vitripennis]|nr:hypothetical protein J6590_071007 [Homalodisca vitripennis]
MLVKKVDSQRENTKGSILRLVYQEKCAKGRMLRAVYSGQHAKGSVLRGDGDLFIAVGKSKHDKERPLDRKTNEVVIQRTSCTWRTDTLTSLFAPELKVADRRSRIFMGPKHTFLDRRVLKGCRSGNFPQQQTPGIMKKLESKRSETVTTMSLSISRSNQGSSSRTPFPSARHVGSQGSGNPPPTQSRRLGDSQMGSRCCQLSLCYHLTRLPLM